MWSKNLTESLIYSQKSMPHIGVFWRSARGAPRVRFLFFPTPDTKYNLKNSVFLIPASDTWLRPKSTAASENPRGRSTHLFPSIYSVVVNIWETLSQSIGCTRSRRGLGTKNEARRFVVVLLVSARCPFPIILTAALTTSTQSRGMHALLYFLQCFLFLFPACILKYIMCPRVPPSPPRAVFLSSSRIFNASAAQPSTCGAFSTCARPLR